MTDRFDRMLLVGLLVAEALIFRTYFLRGVAWHPPENFDQAGMLFDSYRIEASMRIDGFGALWHALWSPGHPNSLVLPIERAVAALLIGVPACRGSS